jgi:hypothetical protein
MIKIELDRGEAFIKEDSFEVRLKYNASVTIQQAFEMFEEMGIEVVSYQNIVNPDNKETLQ